jgi:hypothetical protein
MKQGDITIQNEADFLPLTVRITDASRDMSVTTQVALTGVGFKPRLVWACAYEPGAVGGGSWGMTGATGTQALSMRDRTAVSADTWAVESYLIYIQDGSGGANWFGATINSFDNDGITVDYVANGTSSGNATIRYLCIK